MRSCHIRIRCGTDSVQRRPKHKPTGRSSALHQAEVWLSEALLSLRALHITAAQNFGCRTSLCLAAVLPETIRHCPTDLAEFSDGSGLPVHILSEHLLQDVVLSQPAGSSSFGGRRDGTHSMLFLLRLRFYWLWFLPMWR